MASAGDHPDEHPETLAEITGRIDGLRELIRDLDEAQRRRDTKARPAKPASVLSTQVRSIAVMVCCLTLCLLIGWLGWLFFNNPYVFLGE